MPSGELGLARDSALSKFGCGVRDDGSQAGEDGGESDDSGTGVALPGGWKSKESGWINA